MSYPWLPRVCRPYILHELPGWGRLYNRMVWGIDNKDPRWRHAPIRMARGKSHGYLMELDLSDDIDRSVYFLGRYYDLELQLLLDAVLKPGNTFVDVGANVGYMTLHAASRVAPGGRVISFEPQPRCCQKLRRNLELNDIEHVELFNCGLGEREDKLELKVLGGGSIMSSFCSDEKAGTNVRERIEVEVHRGDDLVFDRVVGNLTLKADVEGFEVYVLRGLERTIGRYRPPILVEVNPEFLRRAGTSDVEQFAFFKDRGYTGYVVSLRERDFLAAAGSRQPAFALRPLATAGGENDVLWLPKENSHFDPTPHLL
jgi:FkbM family methyltransferase